MPYISKRRVGNPNKLDQKVAQDRHNSKWNVFYQDRRWKKLRDWYMVNHPLCEECLFEGRSVPAEHVHHKVPFSTGNTTDDKFALLLDPDNLQSLCVRHHQEIHKLLNSSKT